MAECAARVRAPAPAAAVRQRPHAGRACTAATPPSATSSGWPPPAPRSPTSRSPPTSSSASPARPTTTSSARSRSSPRPSTTRAYTFIFSPRPGTEAAEHGRRLRRARGRAPSASSGSRVVVERRALRQARGARRPRRGGARRGPVARSDPAVLTGPHPPEQARALPRRRGRCGRAPTPTSRVTGAAPHYLRGELVEVTAAPRHRTPHPGGRRLSDRARSPPPRDRRARPRSGKSALALAVARAAGRRRDRLGRLDAGVPGHGHRHGQADAGRAGRGRRTTSSTSPTRPRTFTVVALPARRYDAALADIDARGHRPLLVGGTGLYLRAVVDDLEPPGEWPDVRGRARGRARHRRACTRGSRQLDPVAAAAHGAEQPAPRRAGARGDASAAAGRSRRSAPASTPTRRTDVAQIGLRLDRARLDPAHRGALRAQMLAAGFLDEVARAGGPAGRALPHRAPGPRLPRAARRTSGRAHARRRARRSPCARTRRFAVRQERWFRRDPRVHWIDIDDDPLVAVPRRPRSHSRHASDTSPSTTASATTSSCCSTTQPLPDASTRRARPAAVRPPPGHRRRRADPRRDPAATASADVGMVLHNADGSRAEMSGNGIRCLAQALARSGPASPPPP